MFNLDCVDGFRYPGLEEVYVLDIIPLATGPATISSDQKLCFFNPLSLRPGPTKTLQTNHGNITCAKAVDVQGSVVCTAGEDGNVSVWDLRLDERQAEVARLTGDGVPVLSLACSSENHTVAAGTELQRSQASILLWDVRSSPTPRQQYKEVHSDDVTELNFHPSNPNVLLSGSTDGLVNICDTRIIDEDEVVIQTFNHGSVHHAAFLNDTEVYALSHDEVFALYNVAEEHQKGSATTDFGDMRQVLGCQYIANVSVKANGAGAVIGAGSHEQGMFELVHLAGGSDSWSLNRANSVGLPGAHSSEIVRAFCFYDEAQMVFSVGEDGYIKAWKTNA